MGKSKIYLMLVGFIPEEILLDFNKLFLVIKDILIQIDIGSFTSEIFKHHPDMRF